MNCYISSHLLHATVPYWSDNQIHQYYLIKSKTPTWGLFLFTYSLQTLLYQSPWELLLMISVSKHYVFIIFESGIQIAIIVKYGKMFHISY